MRLAFYPWCVEYMSIHPLHIHEEFLMWDFFWGKKSQVTLFGCGPLAGPTETWRSSIAGSFLHNCPWDEAPSSQGETLWGETAWDSRKTRDFHWDTFDSVILGILYQAHQIFTKIKWDNMSFPKCFCNSTDTQCKVLLKIYYIKPLSVSLEAL